MAKANSLNAAQLLVRCLENEGVKYVFGIPGEENIHFIDALNGSSIRFILVRHEQGAAFMADMYGRLTGRAGVCIATLGPGAINLLLGVADAHTDSAPLVAISAQVALSRIYKESHQGVDLVGMFRPVTKWADIVLKPEAIPEMVRKAFKLAQTERPGAVYLARNTWAVRGTMPRCAARRITRPTACVWRSKSARCRGANGAAVTPRRSMPKPPRLAIARSPTKPTGCRIPTE
jgi:acetolactate synthase-1/2/3 large subunit